MFSNIDDAWVAGAVVALRTQFRGTLIVVEGQDDLMLYERLTDTSRSKIVVAYGRQNALGAMMRLNAVSFSGVLAIVDADFEVLEGRLPSTKNILFTDGHDAEMMMLASPALEKILSEFGQGKKVQKFPDIRRTLMEGARPIGYLLWISVRNKLSLRFDELPFGKFLDKDTLAVDEHSLLKTTINHSQAHHLDANEIEGWIALLKNESHDLNHLCCGHHVTEILSLALCKALGSQNHKDLGPGMLEKVLRLSYEVSFFSSTGLYSNIRDWELKNGEFGVLKP